MDQRIIMHIDMNSYFASCEQQDNLAWRGKPVGVCEHLGGIIIAASIEAKQWGIKTGTPVWEAKRLYPKIILTPTNPDRYRKYTKRFLKVFEDYTNQVERYSIDEAFLNITQACNIVRPNSNQQWVPIDPWQEAAAIGSEIKRRITREVGDWLRCSIGIGGNKLLAKIGSNLRKPDGLSVIRPADKDGLYDRLSLTDVPGIGRRMERQLQALGIHSLRELRDYPAARLVAKFGIPGYHLYNMGQLEGGWKEGFNDSEPIKSIGHMYTMPPEYRRRTSLEPVLYKLAEMVGVRLRVNALMGNVIHVHVHDGDHNCIDKSRRIGYFIEDGRDLYLEAMRILDQGDGNAQSWRERPYLIGVTVAGLAPRTDQQSLFQLDRRKRRLMAALDTINDKYEDFTIARIPAFLARDIIRDSVGFGRMKEFKTSHVRGSHGRFQ